MPLLISYNIVQTYYYITYSIIPIITLPAVLFLLLYQEGECLTKYRAITNDSESSTTCTDV